ncbi:MAG: cardiolipin synthase [Bacteroidales bacterium]|nr:cardiolipin synthase [Bacteroidales bacterium]
MGWLGNLLLALVTAGVILVIISEKGDTGRKVAWLFIIAILPVVGLVLYLLFGISFRHHWIFNRKHRRYIDTFSAGAEKPLTDRLFGRDDEQLLREEYRPLARFLAREGFPTVCRGNDFEIITSGKRKYELLMRDLENAREFIHVEYFHFGNDEGGKAVREMLMKKAREGVKVRFVNENIANLPITPGYYNKMREAGVEVEKFTNPKWSLLGIVTNLNYRDHRKIVVIDGKIGYTGGMNINDHYFKLWRDTHLRITGPAVSSLQFMFMDIWLTAGGHLDRPLMELFPSLDPPAAAEPSDGPVLRDKLMQITPDEPDSTWPLLQMSLEWALSHARRYIWMQTPYFVPPEPLLNAMKVAALSGVEVRLMVPEKTDNFFMRPVNESYYEECLEAGIKIFLRKGEFIHSKTFVSDDYLSCIGTANIDFRSYDLDYEVNTFIYDEETALANKEIFLNDAMQCRELMMEEWEQRPWHKRLMEYIMRLFAPLL